MFGAQISQGSMLAKRNARQAEAHAAKYWIIARRWSRVRTPYAAKRTISAQREARRSEAHAEKQWKRAAYWSRMASAASRARSF